ncbi:MAG: hypothetical protein SGPRY_011835 [Prymnesium sp.]
MAPSSLQLRLALLGFLVNLQPSEPYLTRYLLRRGLTPAQLASQVWPWSSTASFALLLPLALLAEGVGTRPVIFLGLVCREVTRVLLIFASGVSWMAAMQETSLRLPAVSVQSTPPPTPQLTPHNECTKPSSHPFAPHNLSTHASLPELVAYAGGLAANTIYFAYVYSVVTSEEYVQATSLVLASYHAGNVMGALMAQLLVSQFEQIAANLQSLFYLSWLFTTLGCLAFFLLPPPVREAPPALARVLLRRGPLSTMRELGSLYSCAQGRIWLLWWCLGLSAHSVILNYFQLQLAQLSEHIPFGLLEASVEVALVMPIAFILFTSLLRAAAYSLAALGASSHSQGVCWGMNVLAAAVCSLQQAAASAIVATSMMASNRFALVFSTNTLLSNGAAALLGNVGARLSFGTDDYYYAASGLQLVLLLAVPTFSVPPETGGSRSLQESSSSDQSWSLHESDTVACRALSMQYADKLVRSRLSRERMLASHVASARSSPPSARLLETAHTCATFEMVAQCSPKRSACKVFSPCDSSADAAIAGGSTKGSPEQPCELGLVVVGHAAPP